MRFLPFLFLTLFTCSAIAEVPLAEEYQFLLRVNYATGSTAALPLRGGEPTFPIDAKNNTPFLRFEYPAREPGEGIAIPLEGETQNRLLKISLMIRGRGTLEPLLKGPGGAVAHPGPLRLREEWTWVEMVLRTSEAPGTVMLELPAPRSRPGDYIEVQRVTLHAAAEQVPDAVEVSPRAFSAWDYVRDGQVDLSALTTETELRGIPFPRTLQPVALSLSCRANASGGSVTLLTREGTTGQVIAQAPIPHEGGGVVFPNLSARVAGAEVALRITPPAGEAVEVGEIVFSTSGAAKASHKVPVSPSGPALSIGEEQDFPASPDLQWSDDLWTNALPLRDFHQSNLTTARILASPHALHIRFEGEEPLLRVVEQKVHEFRAGEDAYTISLRLPGGNEARTTIYADGRLVSEQRTAQGSFAPWAGPTGSVRMEDGRWSAILNLPLQEPASGVSLSRHSAARGETHHWPGGEHPWGLLFYGKEILPLDLRLPDQWRVGENRVVVENPEHLPRGEWLCHLRLEDENGQRFTQTRVQSRANIIATGGELSLSLPPAWGNRAVRLSLAFLDASLAPLRVFPATTQRIEMPTATLTIGAGPYQVWINDKPFASGTGAVSLTLPLGRGVNEIRLQTSDTAAARLEGEGFPPVRWLESNGELKARLLREETRLWPTPQPAWYVAEGSAQHLAAVMEGAHRGASDWTLCYALPPELEFVAATSFYADRNARQPRFRWEDAGELTLDGRPHRLIRITADKPIPKAGEVQLHDRAAALWTFLRPRPGSAGEAQLTYWSEAGQGSTVEARRSVRVRILPRLAGQQPQRLQWQLWGPLEQMAEPEARAAVLETARQAGITSFDIGSAGSASGWLTDEGAAASGIRPLLRIHFLGGSLSMGPHLREHPEQRLILSNGNASDALVCTSALLAEAWPAVEQLLTGQIRRYRPSAVVYDYEYPPLGKEAVHSCYCPRCIDTFRAHAGFSEEQELNAATISSSYAPQWTDFMALQCARLFRKLKEGTHAAAPGTVFEVYSGYQTPDNPKLYGVDWRYVGQLRAADRATMGYGRPIAAIEATHAALEGIPALFGEILHPFVLRDTTPVQPTTAAAQLRRLIDSRHGVLLYELGGMDGRSWSAVAETTRLAAAHEALFIEGERHLIPGVEAHGALLSGKEGTLYCLMNSGLEELRVTFTLPGDGVEFYTGERFHGEVSLTLQPGESRAISLILK